MDLQCSFLKLPTEQLKRNNRITLKWIEKEIKTTQVYSSDRLKKLKAKLEQTTQDELLQASIVEKRVKHLEGIESNNILDLHTRLNRWLVDYLVYLKCYQSAQALMESENLFSLCDVELYKELQTITQELERRNCKLLLQWCTDNKASLKKSKSSIEFTCRQLEYIQLIKSKDIKNAIEYARQHFTLFANEHQQEIYNLMGLLTTKLDTKCPTYKKLLSDSQWDSLIYQFQTDFATIAGLTEHPILILAIQAGLSALKTKGCHPDKHPHCPCCTTDLYQFSKKLPYSHRTNTCLRCPVTGLVINEDNQPLVLPSGFVISESVVYFYLGR